MKNENAWFEVWRIPGKVLKDQREEKMPTGFTEDCLSDAHQYASQKQNDPANVICEIDGRRSYYSRFVVRLRNS